MVVEHLHLVNGVVEEAAANVRGNLARLLYRGVGGHVAEDHERLKPAVVEVARALLAADDDVGLDAGSGVLSTVLVYHAKHVAVESTGQATVRDHDDGDCRLLLLVLFQQRMLHANGVGSYSRKRLDHGLGIRGGGGDALSRMADLGSRDHFHGARNLLRALDGELAPLDIALTGHALTSISSQ